MIVDLSATGDGGAGPGRAAGIDLAVAALAAGKVVAMPTDTVYGVAVDPSVPGATDRLFSLKHRPREVSIAVLVADPGDAASLVEVDAVAGALIDRFWPGALTIVVPRGAGPGLHFDIGGDGLTVGVRCPDHAVARELARKVGPLATSSANRHREPTAVDAAGVAATFGDAVAVVLDGGLCQGSASTVVAVEHGRLRLVREGRLAFAEIEGFLSSLS